MNVNSITLLVFVAIINGIAAEPFFVMAIAAIALVATGGISV